ncbi:tetratricopeptide repeat protein [Sphingomonas dokdonensis]|uniref:Tetratricopeptide repeat protein n=1 Tax=Sphingomonas dokdonensis TaxID=344880 RepID=A0A245ZEC4_9SPHN|nr:hypothetical protein [Sphingomonas dokdonensis]OWK28095.1 hypothetical protein SPDO_29280 [Sphingomonas dokdonensis]
MLLMLFLMLQASSTDIIVTGKRLEEAHDACVRGECTPLRDAQASIALAEARFRTGKYLQAKNLLGRAIRRNRAKAATDPKPVAALYEAYATVSLHEGNWDDYQKGVYAQVRTLRDNLPPDDPAVQTAATAIGDMWLKVNDPREAIRAFELTEREALRDGQPAVAMLAGLRRVMVMNVQDRGAEAIALLDELEQRPIAQSPRYRTALQIIRLRVSARDADGKELARLIRALPTRQGDTPILIKSPRYDAITPVTASRAAALGNAEGLGNGHYGCRTMGVDAVRWADVGFWIRPDGTTADAEILRNSRGADWTDVILKQIAGRQYSPTAGEPDSPGFYKIERLTQKSAYVTPECSNIARRKVMNGFETLDLTEEGSATPAAAN